MIKEIAKVLVGAVRTRGFHVQMEKDIYIGRQVNLKVKKVLLSPNLYITDYDYEYCNLKAPVIDWGIVQKVRWYLSVMFLI